MTDMTVKQLYLLDEPLRSLKQKIMSERVQMTARIYCKVIDGFIPFCLKNEDKSRSIAEYLGLYYTGVTHAVPFCKPKTTHFRMLARPVLMLHDIMEGREIRKLYRYNSIKMPEVFKYDVEAYSQWQYENNCCQNTVYTRIGRVKIFLIYLSGIGCSSLQMLNAHILTDFIGSLGSRYTSIGKTNILYTIKNYFACPVIKEQLRFDTTPFLENLHTNKHERLKSCYTPNEIRQVLNVVDRTSPNGKMYYLMMILASQCGLRSNDILKMELKSIEWKKKTIVLQQHKTSQNLEIPFTDDVLFALLDYIKNARPKTDDPHLFIRRIAPHVPYAYFSRFSSRVSEYFKKAGIQITNKHAGFHSLRHSLATSLLNDEVPINDIADILGHGNPQTTTRYTWADIEHLRVAALEVKPYGDR